MLDIQCTFNVHWCSPSWFSLKTKNMNMNTMLHDDVKSFWRRKWLKPFVQVEKEALTTIFSLPENGSSSIVKTETVDYSMHSYDDIAVPESDGDHNAFRKVGIDASPCGICIIAIIIFINVIVISQCAQLVSRLLSNLLYWLPNNFISSVGSGWVEIQFVAINI